MKNIHHSLALPLIVLLLFGSFYVASAQVPTITSFSPTSGPVGTTVTITGTNFSTTPSSNIVYFGAVQATVTAATSTSLSVTVPTGATYQPITVTVNGLTAYSRAPFIVTFPGGGSITSASFASKVDFTTGTEPRYVAIGDMDGDGKPDVAVANSASNTVSVLRNTGTSGSVSFVARVDFTTGSDPRYVAIGDMDGDGKPDLAVTSYNGSTVSVFRNTSSGGSTTLAAKVDFTTGSSTVGAAIAEVDGDGKPDLVVVNWGSSTVSVFRNTSSGGSITLAPKVDFTTGSYPAGVAIGDVDGDGKPDVAVANSSSNTVSVFRNTSISGSIGLAAKVDFTTGVNPQGVAIGDVDGDGKPDVAVANISSNTVSVFRNTSTSGSISLAAKVDFTTGSGPLDIAIGDVDGDGKPDVAVANEGSRTVSVFRNTSTSGSVSFAARVDFTAGTGPDGVAIGDLDGDGKPDLVVANSSSNTVSVFRNTIGAAPPTPTLSSPANGSTNQPTTLTLSWNASTGAVTYRLQVSTSSAFTTTVFNDSTITATAQQVGPLAGNTTYYWRVNAKSAGGTSGYSSIFSFTTSAATAAPTVTTSAASSVTSTSATLNGTVNPNGLATTAYFEWGTSSTLATSSTTASQSVGSGTSAVSVTANLTGLSASTTYYYRVVGQNSAGTSRGSIVSFATSAGVTSSTYYVSATSGSNTTGNGSLASPWKTITYALSQITGSGLVQVSAGTYNTTLGEAFPILMKDGVSLVGAGKDVSIIDAGGTNTVIRCVGIVDPTTKIEGFTIENGFIGDLGGGGIHITAGSTLLISNNLLTGSYGGFYGGSSSAGAIYVSNSSPRINDNVISENHGRVSSAGAIYVTGSSSAPIITNNNIVGNSTEAGGGFGFKCGTIVIIGASGTIIQANKLISNTSSDYAVSTGDIFIYGCSPTVKNNIIAKNNMHGVYIASDFQPALPTIINNTISDNGRDGIHIGDVFYTIGNPDSIINNVISYNTGYGIYEQSNSNDPGKVWYNLFYANGSGLYRDEGTTDYYTASSLNSSVAECKNNLAGDPLFVDRVNGNYNLRSGSPAIDAGDPNSPLDLDGTRADIGALPYLRIAPSVPTLSSPANGATNQPTTVTLSWMASTGAATYRLQISTGNDFTTMFLDDSTITTTSRTVSGLANNTAYFWRVSAKNATGTSAYSGTFSFTTIVAAPAAPTLVSPANGATNQSTTLTLTWNASTGAVTYRLQVSTSSAFTTTVFNDSTITATAQQVGPLANNTTYYWRVNAKNAGGTSGYSSTSSFTTVVVAPTTPTLSSPSNGATNQPTTLTLSWSASTGATTYRLQVSTSSAFTTTVFDDSTITTTSRQVGPLAYNTTYYWRVNAKNAGGTSSYSSTWSFTTFVAPPPTITSFTPTSGPIGTTVTITGTNFNPTASNNIVYFGAVRGQVTSASATSLTVTVPAGATYQPITVTDTTTGLKSYSSKPFVATFPSSRVIDATSFATKVDFTTGTFPQSIAIGDLDGDGKPDLAVVNINSNTVSVFRNTSTSGALTGSSFATKVDLATGSNPNSVAVGDLDGDAKLDLAVTNTADNTVSVYRNTSTSGALTGSSFGARVDFTAGLGPRSVSIGDMDGDGKPDLVLVNINSNTVSVYRNTSTSGVLTSSSFATNVDFTTATDPQSVAIADMDGDGKPDLAVANYSSAVISVYRNTSTVGTLTSSSFATKVDFVAGSNPNSIAIGDLDGDGKSDLVVANLNRVSVFRNMTTSGAFTSSSFATKVDFTTGSVPYSVSIGDLDGDGKLDLSVVNSSSDMVSVLRNTSTSGPFTTSSFSTHIDFTTGTQTNPRSVAIGDLDGDGKPDLAVASYGSNSISVLRNTVAPSILGEYQSDPNTILLLHMNEASGSTVSDASSFGNNGTATGTTIVDGRFGKGRDFPNPGDGVIVGKNLVGSGNGSYTLEAWVRPRSYSDINNRRMIFNQRNSTNGPPAVEVYVGNVGELVFLIRNDGSNTYTLSNSIMNPIVGLNSWSHIAVVKDSSISSLRIYINGSRVANGILGNWGNLTGLNSMAIGRNAFNTNNDWFDGLIDEVRISNKARSPSEFNLQLPPKNLTTSTSGTTVALNWQNGGGAVGFLRYKIYRGTDSTNVSLIDSTDASPYTNTGLTTGRRYFYRISAVDSTGFEGAKSYAVSAITLLAKTLYVSPSGSDGNAGTINAPYRSIQTAVKASALGDTIKVAAGEYVENITTQARVAMLGGYDPTFSESARNTFKNKTIIRPTGGVCLTDGFGCAIDGFVFEGASGAQKGIVVSSGIALITHSIVHNFAASGGSGIEVSSGATATIKNNTIANNSLSGGGVIFYSIYILGGSNSSTVIRNNIVYNNDVGIHIAPLGVQSNFNCSAFNRLGNYSGANGKQGTNDITKDPRFVNPRENDFKLKASSPCIDVGDPSDPVGDEPKPNGGRIDLGAYGGTIAATSASQNVPTYVSLLGSDSNPGTIAAPMKSIQAALNSSLGDTVKVASGTYSEGLVIPAYSVILGGYGTTFVEDQRNIFLRKTTLLGVSAVMIYDRFGSVIDGFFVDGNATAETAFDVANGTSLTHNVIINVTGGFGYAVRASGPVFAINNTMRKNTRAIALESAATGSVVKNNIFAENSFAVTNSAANGIARYNDFTKNAFNYTGSFTAPGIGDLAVDPQFRDAAAHDYRLASGSPCIDAGDPADPVGDEPVPNGGRIDMGVYGGTKQAGGPRGDPHEPNNTANEATFIAYPLSSEGAEIVPAGDVDYFKFTASAGDFVEIEVFTEETSELDVKVDLFDAAGNELVTNDMVGTGTERILYGFDKQGVYYIRIAQSEDPATFPNKILGGVSDGSIPEKVSVSPTGSYALSLALGSPLPPTSLLAGESFDGLVPLRWDPPASNSPLGYRVSRSTSLAGSYSVVGTTSREDFVDTTAVNAVNYFYRVASIYGATISVSGPSNVARATPQAGGYKLTSKYANVKPQLDGVLQLAEWSDAAALDVTYRRTVNPPARIMLYYKNDDQYLYLAVDDSNGTALTYNRLAIVFDLDNNKMWDPGPPSSEGVVLVTDSSDNAVVTFYGVHGAYPSFSFNDDAPLRNPPGVRAALSQTRGHIQYEVALDFSRVAPTKAISSIGLYVAIVSDDANGEYPLGALTFAPLTFADLSLAKAAASTVSTGAASNVTATSATLNGTVNPGGQNVNAWFEYGTDSLLTAPSTSPAKQILAATSDISFSDGITGLSTGTIYDYRLAAQNSVGIQRGSIRSFITVPSPPTIELPTNGATDEPLSITFTWKGSTGATAYRLQISTNNLFTTLFLDDSTITGTSRLVASFLNNTTYYWRVGAKNASGTSEFSDVFGFTTVAAGPAAPTLSSPANGATGVSTNPMLSWSASTGATSYRLQVSTSSAFTTSVFEDSTLTATSRQVGPLANNTTYYWRVRAKGAGGASAYSPTANFATTATMTVSTPSPISFPTNPTTSTDYRLFSIPGGSSLVVSDLFSGAQKTDWRIYRDNGASTNYLVELSTTSQFRSGEGYWLLKKGSFSIASRTVQAVPLSSDATYSIPLNANGWTIVGNPFDKSVSWATVLAANGITASATALLRDYTGSYSSTATMEPYKAYYYYNNSPQTSLKIPYPFSGKIDQIEPPFIEWQLQLKFSSDINEDSENFIGISPSASEDFDALESFKPPLFMDQGFLYFSRPTWSESYSRFSSDYRPSIGEGRVWEFEVSNPRMSQAKIEAIGMEQVPLAYDVKLIDPYNSEPFDLRPNNTYSYRTVSERMSFKLMVGSREFVQKELAASLPQEFDLTQNFPNPFNPSTAISIKLPRVASVRLEIVSLLGQHVKTIAEGTRNPGTHTFIWDARDERGQSVATGPYFYRLFVDGNLVKSRKMLLTR